MNTKTTKSLNKFLAEVRDGSKVTFQVHGHRLVKVPAQQIKTVLWPGLTGNLDVHNEIILEEGD